MATSMWIFLSLLPHALQGCNPIPNSNTTPVALVPNLPSIISSTTVSFTNTTQVANISAIRTMSDPDPPIYTNEVDCGIACGERKTEKGTGFEYQLIKVSGLPFQRGESHGQQAKEKILTLISHYKTSRSMPTWDDCIRFVNMHYIEALKYYYPNGLEEMKGIASGAGVPLDDILILNARYDLTRWKRSTMLNTVRSDRKGVLTNEKCLNYSTSPTGVTTFESADINATEIGTEECTGAVALSSSTKYAHVLLGQNWDTSDVLLKNNSAILLEVHPHPCEGVKPFVMLTEAGQLGRSGMNADGLGIVAMSLWSSADTFDRPRGAGKGWVPVSLMRRMFLEAPNFALGLRTLLRTPRHVSVNMIIATAEDEALNIELTPDEYFVTNIPLGKEVFVHSNHFKSPAFVGRDHVKEGSRGSSSLFRDRRVEKHLLNAWPRINEGTFQTAFKDHVGYPNSVCEHADSLSASQDEVTVASIIFNLSQRTLQLCKGPPCMGIYKNYRFKFSKL